MEKIDKSERTDVGYQSEIRAHKGTIECLQQLVLKLQSQLDLCRSERDKLGSEISWGGKSL